MFSRIKAPVSSKAIAIMPRSVRATWLDDIRGTGRNANATPGESAIHSLPQLLDFLANATNRLIDLMKLSGTGILIRSNKNEIMTLKAAIHQREVTRLR
jgi:hypothetical protein